MVMERREDYYSKSDFLFFFSCKCQNKCSGKRELPAVTPSKGEEVGRRRGERGGISICWRIANFRRRKGLDSEIQEEEEEEEEERQQKRKRRIGDAERWKRGGEKRKRDSEKKFFIFPGKRSECASEKKSSPICCWGKKFSPSCRCVAKGIFPICRNIYFIPEHGKLRELFLELSGRGHL